MQLIKYLKQQIQRRIIYPSLWRTFDMCNNLWIHLEVFDIHNRGLFIAKISFGTY